PSGEEKEKATLRVATGGPASGKLERPTLDSAQPPDRARQCFVLVRAILLLGQHGNPLLAFLLRSNKAHDAVDSDGIAPLVEALDHDYSLTGFHGDNVHFEPLMFVSSYHVQGPTYPPRSAEFLTPAAIQRNAAVGGVSLTSYSFSPPQPS